jgi:hypothetical protein
MELWLMSRSNSPFDDAEYELIMRIRRGDSDRDRLIGELDRLPVRYREFYARWLLINNIEPFACWTDAGYDPTRSDIPRDIQLLWAASYGTLDIENGGFLQFFGNFTGNFAPEMVEWFTRAGLTETALIVRKAIAVFGEVFPRSQAAREQFLRHLWTTEGQSRDKWGPFDELDDLFYDSLPRETKTLDPAADQWVREVCGVEQLDQAVPGRTKQ